MSRIFLLALLLSITIVNQSVNARKCCTEINNRDLVGQSESGNKCYFVNFGSENWATAEGYCAQKYFYKAESGQLIHGRLAFVENNDRLIDMKNLLYKYYHRENVDCTLWIGLLQTDTSNEPAGGWNWMNSDAHSINKSSDSNIPWHSGQPDNGGGQNCATLLHQGGELGLDDDHCNEHHEYICEIDT